MLVSIDSKMYALEKSAYNKLRKFLSKNDIDGYNELLQKIEKENKSIGIIQNFYYK